jgi:hypothetical protein
MNIGEADPKLFYLRGSYNIDLFFAWGHLFFEGKTGTNVSLKPGSAPNPEMSWRFELVIKTQN